MTSALRNHPEQWPLDSRECIFLGRVLDRLSDDEVWTALRSGELEPRVYCVGRTDFWPIQLSPLVLLDKDKDAVFANCQIEMLDKDTRRPAAIRRRIPVPHWLYVTRASLEKFEKAQPAATNAAETRAAKVLADHLRHKRDMKRSEAASVCGLDIRSRAFQRVWETARGIARLPAQGSPGRPAKSTQKSAQKSTH